MNLTQKISQQIQDYLNSEKKPLICVVWPTATWKTEFAIEIAEEFSWELINCDSKQIYKDIECVTWLDYDELKWTKNHFFWIAEISDKYWTSAKFLEEVEKLIFEIYERWNVPVLVWWTGLFFSSLIEWFEIPKNSTNPEILESFKNKTNEELFEELQKVDFEYSEKTHKNNRIRVERALEFFYSSWQKKSSKRKNNEKRFNPLIFCKNIFWNKNLENSKNFDEEREKLYQKINFREEKIFLNSIKKISEILKNFSEEEKNFLPALKSIWIPEINLFLEWQISQEEAIKKTQQSARNYAKRQMTWWRRREWINLID